MQVTITDKQALEALQLAEVLADLADEKDILDKELQDLYFTNTLLLEMEGLR